MFSFVLGAFFLLSVSSTICEGALDWYQIGPIYQIYPASFADSDGDGWGDIKGVLEHAEYFKEIGVGAVWLSPIFKSPMQDNGYDVSNYTDINPLYGNLQDLIDLMNKLHSYGIKMMLDFVPNHSSDQHAWFQNSINEVEGYEDFYVWKDGRSSQTLQNGTVVRQPPNNWRSLFAPSAWTWNDKRKKFYLHQFGEFQPDLNYENPKVIAAMQDAIRFWLKLGVDGMRVDATPYLIETNYDKDEPDVPGCQPANTWFCQNLLYTKDQPALYDIIEKFASVLDEFQNGTKRFQFIEAYAAINWTMMYYMNSTAPFNFNLLSYMNKESNATQVKYTIDLWLDNMPNGSWPNWVTGNHDNSRVATRFGEEMVDAINMLSMLLPGTPITYQGEELGMTDVYVPPAQRRDKTTFSRDPERTPMQWNASTNAGFSQNKSVYLPVSPNYWRINVAAESATDNSHLSVYKKLVSLHKSLSEKQFEDFQTYVISERVFGFSRPDHLILINLNNLDETISLSNLTLPNNKTLPATLYVKIPSINSNLKTGDKIDPKRFFMRSSSSVVLSLTGGSATFKPSAFFLITTIFLAYFRF